ncbi:glycosyltransferase family 39 protein [Coleofasciculus sp. LEGE 07092]|nr:glycosyltransferase family 39 protein [Coleofasciculus sp. LEGE 07081]MBE9147228.1 glycosyltransferase family 39 protein [Coleofasciculus sp. LEGE 07092]
MINFWKSKTQKLYGDGLKALIIIAIVLGLFFRFVNLDGKIYWFDEVLSSLRIAGYTRAELFQEVASSQPMTLQDLQHYQSPNSEKGLRDTIKSLVVEDPLQSPLYFILGRFWMQLWGNSVAVIRSLSALSSLLAFPCLYWLCRELFESPLVGWIAMALIAVSPFHVLYAQEARMYSLWTVTILLSSAVLLKAMRVKTHLSWGTYAATVALGLYTHLFSIFVFMGHGVYVLITERYRFSKRFRVYLLASLAGFLGFLPWILVVASHLSLIQQQTAWQSARVSVLSLGQTWVVNLSRIFFDVGIGAGDAHLDTYAVLLIVPILSLLGLSAYAVHFLYRYSPKHVRLFVLTSIGATALALILPDLIIGGRRSTFARYLIPSYLGIQLAVAYLFSTKVTIIPLKTTFQKLWQSFFVLVLSAGILSCVISARSETWWNKSINESVPQVARLINQSKKPLLISDNSEVSAILPLIYVLDNKVKIMFIATPKIPNINSKFNSIFLIYASEELRDKLEENRDYKIDTIYKPGELLLLEKSRE